MSTKIYSGYRIPNFSSQQLIMLTSSLRAKFTEVRNKTLLKLWPHLADPKSKEKPDWLTIQEMAWKVEHTKQRNPLVDYAAELVVFPLSLPDKTLCITYWDCKVYDKLWNSLDYVQFYGWWDNTDPDEDCSSEEWKQREKDWAQAMTDEISPAKAGLTLTIMDYMIPLPQQLRDFRDKTTSR